MGMLCESVEKSLEFYCGVLGNYPFSLLCGHIFSYKIAKRSYSGVLYEDHAKLDGIV